MKEFLKHSFPGFARFYNRMYNHMYHFQFYGKARDKVFAKIYNNNHWRNTESISGPGSTINRTQSIRKNLASIIELNSIKFIIDVPCGDFNWMKLVDLSEVTYVGLDIVPSLIQDNLQKYSKENISFRVADLVEAKLEPVDLIFCRDCFVHLSFADIKKSIVNIKASGSKYLLTTTFTKHTNFDIVTGNWRQINLEASPFDFPTPIHLIVEDDLGENQDKAMALWRIEDIPDF